MAALVGLTLIKRMTYRLDATEEFSNHYVLTGSVPADSAAWKTLSDALIAQEKTIYPSNISVVRAYGYATDNPDDASVWSYDYLAATASVPGTLTVGSSNAAPGDAAVWCRWRTSRNNTKGKPIYLRKYFHGARTETTPDQVLAAQKTALGNFAVKLSDASFLDARTIRSFSHAETIVGTAVSQYVTTRTLKRRGKRPGS